MRFWDTSGIVPLLLEQGSTADMESLLAEDPEMAVWWGTPVECASAAARLRREGLLSLDEEEHTLTSITHLQEAWMEVLPSERVRSQALRLLRVHSLKAADALQLAAALIWRGPGNTGELVTLDERLALAARLEGFRVRP